MLLLQEVEKGEDRCWNMKWERGVELFFFVFLCFILLWVFKGGGHLWISGCRFHAARRRVFCKSFEETRNKARSGPCVLTMWGQVFARSGQRLLDAFDTVCCGPNCVAYGACLVSVVLFEVGAVLVGSELGSGAATFWERKDEMRMCAAVKTR